MADPLILVDADACPVKDEVYKVALRHKTPVTLIANSFMRTPPHELITLKVVGSGFDEADDHVAELSGPHTVAITADILLAERCLKAGALVIGPNGKPFTEASIGGAIATRAIMQDLRDTVVGGPTGGPAPFSKEDRSRFLSALDQALVKLKRA
ncbi:MAG: YaiI/YqxD family protein [Pseudomonadota bacterium]